MPRTDLVGRVVVVGLRLVRRVQPRGGLLRVVADVADVADEVALLVVALRLAPVRPDAPVRGHDLRARVPLDRHAPAPQPPGVSRTEKLGQSPILHSLPPTRRPLHGTKSG